MTVGASPIVSQSGLFDAYHVIRSIRTDLSLGLLTHSMVASRYGQTSAQPVSAKHPSREIGDVQRSFTALLGFAADVPENSSKEHLPSSLIDLYA